MIARRDPSAARFGAASDPTIRRLGRRSALIGGVLSAGVAIALVGCGGTGGSRVNATTGVTTAGTTASDGGSTAVLNLPATPGQVAVSFLTGAGRAAGDRTAVIRRIGLTDANGTEETRLQGERRLVLNRYSSQILPLNVATVGTSRVFSTFEFDVLQFITEDANSSGGTDVSTFDSIANLPINLPANIRTFPGRTTHVPFFLDENTIVANNGTASFDQNRFNEINFRPEDIDPDTGRFRLRGQLADYVAFDVSNMAASDRPTMSNGAAATRLFFSGDGYAVADGNPYGNASVNFEPLLPGGQADVLLGRLSGPQTLPSQGGIPQFTPGTYSMIQADPSDVNSPIPRRITSLQGTWREHFRQTLAANGTVTDVGYLRNAGTFEAITIPSSNDDARQDLVAVVEQIVTNADGTRSARVTNAYFGYIDLEQNRFFMYPIKNLYSVLTTNNLQGEVSGTISDFTYSGAASPTTLRAGRFNFSSGAPSGFPTNGRFLVLRG